MLTPNDLKYWSIGDWRLAFNEWKQSVLDEDLVHDLSVKVEETEDPDVLDVNIKVVPHVNVDYVVVKCILSGDEEDYYDRYEEEN